MNLDGGKGLPADLAESIGKAAAREAARRTRTTLPPARPAADAARKRLPQGATTGTPKHRVRRVAVLFGPGRESEAAELWAALHDIGKAIKTPVFLRAVLLESVAPDSNAQALAGKAGVGGALAALALLDGLLAPLQTRIAEAFEKRGVRLLSVPAGKSRDRATLVDLMAELLVMNPERDFDWEAGFR